MNRASTSLIIVFLPSSCLCCNIVQESFVSEALSMAGGRAAAMAACTCKAWKGAADDDRVWRAASMRDHGTANHETPTTSGRDEYKSRERARRNWDDGSVTERTCTGGSSPVVLLATGRTAGRTVVAAGMFDGAVRAWDVSTGKSLGCIPSRGMLMALATDGDRLSFVVGYRLWPSYDEEEGHETMSTRMYVQTDAIGSGIIKARSGGDKNGDMTELAAPPPVDGLPDSQTPGGGGPLLGGPLDVAGGSGSRVKLALRAGRVVVGGRGGWLCAWDGPGVAVAGTVAFAAGSGEVGGIGGRGGDDTTCGPPQGSVSEGVGAQARTRPGWRLLVPGTSDVAALAMSPDGRLVCAATWEGLHLWSLPRHSESWRLPLSGSSSASGGGVRRQPAGLGGQRWRQPVASTSFFQLSGLDRGPEVDCPRCLALDMNGAVALGDLEGGLHVWQSWEPPPSLRNDGGEAQGSTDDHDGGWGWCPAVSARVSSGPVRDVALTGTAALAISGDEGGSVCIWQVLQRHLPHTGVVAAASTSFTSQPPPLTPSPESYEVGVPDDLCVAMAVEWDCVVMARDHRRDPHILDFHSPSRGWS